MNLTKETVQTLIGRTVTDPRGAAEQLMRAQIPRQAVWPLLILVVLASTLLSGALNLAYPAEGAMAVLVSRPFVSAAMTFAGLVMMIGALHWVGRMLGGKGEMTDMVLAMTWLQFMLFIGQIGILILALVVPPLAAFLFLIYLGFSVWLAVAFVDAVHGFDNYFKAFGVILLALLAIGIALSILLTLFGVSGTGVPMNV